MLAEKAALLGRETGEEDTTQIMPVVTPGESDDPLALHARPPPPISQPEEGAMSEKARGKMRATESTTSLSLNGDVGTPGVNGGEGEVPDEDLMKVAEAGVGPNKYVPTQEWVSSWQKG